MQERSEQTNHISFLFVGENRSLTAIRKGYTWENVPSEGALCAKKLFTALRNAGIEPREHSFINIEDDKGNPQEIIPDGRIVVAMGLKVQKELNERGIPFLPIVHPAARGIWCRQDEYNKLINNVFIHLLES
jgi:hypothetical protein